MGKLVLVNSVMFFHDCIKDRNLLVHVIEHFVLAGELMDKILHRMPLMEKAEIRSMINGPESFTPDSRYLLGEVPEVGL